MTSQKTCCEVCDKEITGSFWGVPIGGGWVEVCDACKPLVEDVDPDDFCRVVSA